MLIVEMEEERTKLRDLQENEKIRLYKMQNSAAIKIQASFKAFIAYKHYNPIIKEQMESKNKKAQEWKKKEAKIRQWEEERQKRLEEEQRTKEEKKKKEKEEFKKRQKEYEEKKISLKLDREQVSFKRKLRVTEESRRQLMSMTLEKTEYNTKHLTVKSTPMNKNHITPNLVSEKSKTQDVPLWLIVDEKSNRRGNVGRKLVSEELIQEKLKEHTPKQEIMAEPNEEEKKESLTKQQYSEKLLNSKRKYENIDKQCDLESPDLKENVKETFKPHETKLQIPKEEELKHTIDENVEQEIQILMLGHNQDIDKAKSNEAQKVIRDNRHEKIQVEKERIPGQNETLYEENSTSAISMEQELLPLELAVENIGEDDVVKEEDTDLKSSEAENSEDNALNRDIVVFNPSEAIINREDKIDNHGDTLRSQALPGNSSGCDEKSSLVSMETNSIEYEIKELSGDCPEDGMAHSKPEPPLLTYIEEKRLAWIQSCKPWFECFKKHQQKNIVKKKRSVKCPVDGTLPPLSTLDILQLGSWDTLQQVTTVTFQDLPGCNLSTLAECSNLQFLSLQRCGLTSLHSLGNCKHLKYIDVQENHIQTINCENLENLCILLLNKNQLSSLHGLDGCTNLQNLELSHNKIIRIGGLESLKNLQQLILDHNQLIGTKGLSDTPTLIYLDCSHNHLTEVHGIANCGLLQILKLQGNYLSELPSLDNHVLLRELHLDDNSISTVDAFSSYWLPLLQNLTLSQNSLTEMIPLFHFVSLEKLDISNNCLSDLTSVIKWLDSCFSLHELSLTGNPFLQEINWRQSLLKMLPTLRILNGEMVNCYSDNHPEDQYQLKSGCFTDFKIWILCQSQIREFNLLTENYVTRKGNMYSLDGVEKLCDYFQELTTLSHEYRYAHENMYVSIIEKNESEAKQNHLAHAKIDNLQQNVVLNSYANSYKPDSSNIAEKWIDSGSDYTPVVNSSMCNNIEEKNQENINHRRIPLRINISTKRIPFTKTVSTTSLMKNCQNIQYTEKIMATIIIQAYWRGYIVRKHFSTKLHTAETEPMKSQPNSHIKNQNVKEGQTEHMFNIQEQREKAAILIQAVWKGFLLRKKLTTALEAIKNEDSEEYEEIDLEDFTFDEAAFEKEWLALDSSRFPSQTQLLPSQLHWPKYPGTYKYDDTSLNLPSHPAQAWLCNEKENMFSPEHTQFNNRSESRALSWTPESKTGRKSLLKSEREKKISEEWGFKDISTAQQMLKRAQKMKSKRIREKKGPAAQLALFQNSESKRSVTRSQRTSQPRRGGYVEVTPRNIELDLHLETYTDNLTNSKGKEEEVLCKDAAAHEKLEKRREFTYQWLHTQVGVHETTSSRNTKCNHFLPELDPDVLNGGRVQLVARLVSREDTDLDLSSMTSGSALSVNREKKNQAHRHSAGSSSGSIKGIFAPMITNARPSKKERISFRDNPVQLSGGWGSGKKKAKTSN
ncbi:leucine-rich repeat and IQ domain-containing protein 1 [Echinops telfairi]|uniref:Leucine-rich repeat and IQ domain-containing protein 1 n=1 Tax=Echinops telfairi TaxID=9371 RepID=A0AC55CYJ8_ECHTE|nr:leucine-rich repeat and IQ domain-containing protein 1 [Echinops telfairi]